MPIYQRLLEQIWRGYDSYYGFPAGVVKPDLQGWESSQHRYLTSTVAIQNPSIIIEIGVWKGASCFELARAIQKNELDAVVIAVDTWLGAWDHWTNDQWHHELGFEFGYPSIYRTFLANMVLGGVKRVVIPLPLDSINAWYTLRKFAITPDMVHIDGGHDYDTVFRDVSKWWDLLSPGGTMITTSNRRGGWRFARRFKTFLKEHHLRASRLKITNVGSQSRNSE
jgi:hypothetical protein